MIDWRRRAPVVTLQCSIEPRVMKMSSLRDRYSFASAEPAPAARRTLRTAISCVGRGLHSGVEVALKPVSLVTLGILAAVLSALIAYEAWHVAELRDRIRHQLTREELIS